MLNQYFFSWLYKLTNAWNAYAKYLIIKLQESRANNTYWPRSNSEYQGCWNGTGYIRFLDETVNIEINLFIADGIGNNWGTKFILPTEVFAYSSTTLYITTSEPDVRIYSDGYFNETVASSNTVAVSLAPTHINLNNEDVV